MSPFAWFGRRARLDDELREEIRTHLEMAARDRMAQGESREEAEATARREFGNEALVREVTREMWGWVWLEHLAQDVRYAVRGLVRSPGLAAAVVVILTLGLGANAAVFSLLDRIFLRQPAGVEQPEEVLRLYQPFVDMTDRPIVYGYFSYPALQAMRATVGRLGTLAAYNRSTDVPLGPASGGRGLTVDWAGPSYFDVLGVHPERGRFFAPEEERMGAGMAVAVVSDALWRTLLGADPNVLGRSIELDGARYTVVGVAAPGFRGTELDAADVWLPLALLSGPGAFVDGKPIPWYAFPHQILALLARPASGVTPARLASAATSGARTAARQTEPRLRGPGDTLVTVSTGPLIAARGPAEKASGIPITIRLAGVALIVLLIACANVANLLLARGMRRRREIAVRLALGVGRRRLITQLATESLLLAIMASGGALLVGVWGGLALRAALMPETHWSGPVLSGRAIGIVLLATIGCGLLTGLTPALRSTRPDLTDALKAGVREGGPARSRLRDALIVLQAALSVILLVGAGLFIRSLGRVERADIGFDAERLVYAVPSWDAAPPASADREAGLARVAERLRRMPGVERVTVASNPPMGGSSYTPIYLGAGELRPIPGFGSPSWTAVAPDYFAAVGLRILRGRAFGATDGSDARRTVVVNRTLANLAWPARDPLGHCLRVGSASSPCATVAGVVEDARRDQVVEQPTMQFYVPLDNSDTLSFGGPRTVIVRARPGQVDAASASATRAVRDIFPSALPGVWRMTDRLSTQYRPWRVGAGLFTALGLLALVVAAFGIYSALAYAFSLRTHEIGVRLALGARPADVLRLVLGEGLRLVILGLVTGSAIALAAGRLVASLLYGTSPRDPVVLVVVALVLVLTAASAALAPARRATRVDPSRALNAE